MKHVYIKTQGCQMNEYDAKRIGELLHHSHGLELTGNPEEADLLVLNTCSVRDKAQEKVFSELGRWKHFKERGDVFIAVGGCVASQEGERLRARAPYVDMVFGPQSYHRLPQMLHQLLKKKKAQVDVSFPEIEKFDCLPKPRANGYHAYVTIMEGCSKYCSFCVVPYTRGEEYSRPVDDVIAEVDALQQQGVREITLLGQNVNGYRGALATGGRADFGRLLYLIAAMDGIGRIRYTTSHPLDFSDSQIQAHRELCKLAAHVHLPVQSGSNRILTRMKRRYTREQYLHLIERIREANPAIRFSSDFIVGFPGETQQDFEQTLDLVRTVGFDQSFSFIYSPRPGTPASELDDPVPYRVKLQRLGQLQALLKAQAQSFDCASVGQVERILVQGRSKKSEQELSGRSESNRVINFPGTQSLIGKLIQVRVTDAMPNSLRGTIVST